MRCSSPSFSLPGGRNCPDLYGGIATVSAEDPSIGEREEVGTALICMEGLRLIRVRDMDAVLLVGRHCPDLHGGIATLLPPNTEVISHFTVGTALTCMEGLRRERHVGHGLEREPSELP